MGKSKTVEEAFFLKGETAVEIDEEGFSPLRDEDVPLMSQIQVDHPSLVDFSEHLFQVREERRLKSLSSLDGSSRDKFHCKSETINSLNSLRDTMNPLQPGVYLPFLMNEPEPQCPTKKKIFSPNILDHDSATFYLHSTQVRLSKGTSLNNRDGVFLVFFSVHDSAKSHIKTKVLGIR